MSIAYGAPELRPQLTINEVVAADQQLAPGPHLLEQYSNPQPGVGPDAQIGTESDSIRVHAGLHWPLPA